MTLAVQRLSSQAILPNPMEYQPFFEEGAVLVEAGEVREAAAEAIVGRAEVAASHAATYSTPITNAIIMSTFLAYGFCMNALATVMMYEANRALLNSDIGQPLNFVGKELVQGAVTGVVSATGLCKAQFEGENSSYRPSTSDVVGKLKEKGVGHLSTLSSRVKKLVI